MIFGHSFVWCLCQMCSTSRQRHIVLFGLFTALWIALFTLSVLLTLVPCKNCAGLHTFEITLGALSCITIACWARLLVRALHYLRIFISCVLL